MTGSEMICFIRENKLEGAEIGFGDSSCELCFGSFKPRESADAEDRINYVVRENNGATFADVEFFRHKGGTDPEFVSISPEKALSLRVSVRMSKDNKIE